MTREEAYDNLERAIAQLLEFDGEVGILSDWALVTHVLHDMDDDGSHVSTSVTSSRHQPGYRTLGLLEYGAAAVRAGAVERDDD